MFGSLDLRRRRTDFITMYIYRVLKLVCICS